MTGLICSEHKETQSWSCVKMKFSLSRRTELQIRKLCRANVTATPFWCPTIFVGDWHGMAKSPRRVRHAWDKIPNAIRKVMAVNRSSANRKPRLFLFVPFNSSLALLRHWPVERQKSIGLTLGPRHVVIRNR